MTAYNSATMTFNPTLLSAADMNTFRSDLVNQLSAPQPTGASVARALTARFSDTINLLDYILPTDADATNAIRRAIAAAQALNRAVCIYAPNNVYIISDSITVTLTGNQSIYFKGDGSSNTYISQTVDKDAFSVTLGNYGNFGLGGAFNVTGVSFVTVCPTSSTTRTALSINTNTAGAGTGCPLILDDIVISSPRAANAIPCYWGLGIKVSQFSNLGYISRISIYSSGAKGIGIFLGSPGPTYQTSILLSDVFIAGTFTGLVLGDFMQGIAIDNLNTVNTTWSIRSEPTLPAGDSAYVITRSYLMGKAVFHALEGAVAQFQIRMANCYFDGNVNGAAAPIDRHVSFINVPQVTLTGCTFNGAGPLPANPILGLYIDNQSYDTIVSNCTFGGYGTPADGSTSCAVYLTALTANATFSDNTFDYNMASLKDLGTGNVFANSRIRRSEAGADGYYLLGTATLPSTTPGTIAGGLAVLDFTQSLASASILAGGNANGASLLLGGNGVNASKTIRAQNGLFQILNNAKSAAILQLSDAGALGVPDLTVNGTDLMAGAWTLTAPTPVSATGTITTATGSVRTKKMGRTVFFSATATITTNGTGGATVNILLPYASAADEAFGGRNFSSGKEISAVMVSGTSTLIMTLYDGTYPAADGNKLVITGCYESAA